MKNIKTLVLGLGAAFALTACGGDSVVKEMEAMKDKICACKDAECVAKVVADAEKDRGKDKDMTAKMEKLSDEDKATAAVLNPDEIALALHGARGPPKPSLRGQLSLL